MKKQILLAALISASACLTAADEIPRQFRVWGRKAPTRLGSYDPVPGKRGLESVRIPENYREKTPETNLTEPDVPPQFKELGYIPFVTHPMTFVYRVTRPKAGEIDKPVRAFATPGEYVPLTFAIRTLKPVNCVEIEIGDFTAKDGTVVIPRRNIDLRRVMDLYIPTLEKNEYITTPKYLESFDEFDILNIDAGTTERFWLTVKVPDNAPAGTVNTTITVKARNAGSYSFKSAIRVLPFKLAVPDPFTEINFQILSNSNDPRFLSYGRDNYPDQMNRVFVDMIEHGMTSNNYEHVNPYFGKDANGKLVIDFDRPGMTSYYSMNDFMYILKRAGFSGPFCYYNGPNEWSNYGVSGLLKYPHYSEEYNQALRELVKATEEQRVKQHWPEFIYFLGDEPGTHSDRIKMNRNLGQQVKAVAPNAKTSNFFNGEWHGVRDWQILKDVTDINCTNYVNAATLKDSKAAGYDQLWIYNGALNYATDHRGQRIFYGFQPWKVGARGVNQYKYRAFYPDSPSDKNDFTAYDQLNGNRSNYDYTYPAADGPIPTPKWEGVRQGIYDYRYLLTLKKAIENSKNTEATEVAKKELESVMANFFPDYQSERREQLIHNYSPETLDVYRWHLASAIMKLL